MKRRESSLSVRGLSKKRDRRNVFNLGAVCSRGGETALIAEGNSVAGQEKANRRPCLRIEKKKGGRKVDYHFAVWRVGKRKEPEHLVVHFRRRRGFSTVKTEK